MYLPQLFCMLQADPLHLLILFLRQSIRENAIPFEIRRNIPNSATLAAIEKAENNEDMYGPFDSVEALMEELNA